MTDNKRFNIRLADKWPYVLALLIFVAFAFAGCQQFIQQNPIAVISATPTSGTPPLDVSFDGTGSSDPDGTIASYTWTFGDGGTGTGATQTHSYTTEGTYTATLTVTDNDGLTNTDSVSITVSAAPTPTGEYIYFASNRSPYNIYRMDTDGSDQAQITWFTGDEDNLFPSLPYDSRSKLAFASDRDDGNSGGNNKFDIFKSEVDGTLPINLTSQTAYSQIEPSWNNDGSKITYASNETGDWEVWVMNSSGSGEIQLTNQTPSTELAPIFSPDGTKIIYVSDKGHAGNTSLWTMDADGSNQTEIYDNTGDCDGSCGYDPTGISLPAGFGGSTPSWSPDGTKIAFTSDQQDGNNDIYVIDSDGSNLKPITSETGLNDDNCFDPFWLPNGDEIAFVVGNSGQYEIWKVDVSNLDNPGGVDQLATLGDNLSPANEPWNQ